jgi:hypothetical protein
MTRQQESEPTCRSLALIASLSHSVAPYGVVKTIRRPGRRASSSESWISCSIVNMPSSLRSTITPHPIWLSPADQTQLSLRNHLCLVALGTEHRTPFHLGTIIRTMFDSFFLFEAGFGHGSISTYIDADLSLGYAASSAHSRRAWSLHSDAVRPISRLLEIFDRQLQVAPFTQIVNAHKRTDANFRAPPEERQSIAVLVECSTRNIT